MADLPKVLVLQPPWIFDYYGDQFAENFHLLKAWESPLPTEQFVKTYAASVEAMICGGNTQINADTLRIIPAIRLIVADSVGLDNIDLTECRRRGVAVTNAGEAFSPDVADMAVGLLIDVLRKISAADRFVRAGLWPVEREYPPGSKVGGRRVGIVGLGSIGSRVAKRLVAFGCSISYNQRHIKPDVPYIYYNNVVDLATNSDVLVISCTLTDQTFHMINNQVLSALGKKGVIINIARGAIIDETELVKFLVKGDIAGAGLDVFENEPKAPEELFEMDNVVFSPHRGSSTEESVSGLV